MTFPLPKPPHILRAGDRANYVLEQVHGEVLKVSTEHGDLGLPYCLVKWDDGVNPSWVLMQHLWPERP